MGARWDEFDSPVKTIDPKVEIKENKNKKFTIVDDKRAPMAASIGFADASACAVRLDLRDGETVLVGATKRLLQVREFEATPKILKQMYRLSESLAGQFEPVDPTASVDPREWLEHSNYTGSRKQQMLDAIAENEAMETPMPDHVDWHPKEEAYGKLTHQRAILARPDRWKVEFGPVIHLIEQTVFKNKCFVKYTSQKDRFKQLVDMLHIEGETTTFTDHTSYEAVFRDKVRKALALPIYARILGEHPCKKKFMAAFTRVVANAKGQTVKGKFYTLKGVNTECSGEVDTSLNNGLSNLDSAITANELSQLEELEKRLIPWLLLSDDDMANEMSKIKDLPRVTDIDGFADDGAQVRMICEGDDGSIRGKTKTNMDAMKRQGYQVTAVEALTVENENFCKQYGLVANPMLTCIDPIEVLTKFGFFGYSYVEARRGRKMALYRARAMSLLSSYPDMPILGSFVRWVLRATAHVDMSQFLENDRTIDRWQADKLKTAVKAFKKERLAVPDVHYDVRWLVESRFGIEITHQLLIEQYFDGLNDIQFIDCPYLRLYWPDPAVKYAARYVVPAGAGNTTPQPALECRYDNLSPEVRSHFENCGIRLRSKRSDVSV